MPANPSSSIPAALARLVHADPLRPAGAPQLLAYLAAIHDPRRDCGRRYPLVAILAIAAAAVLAGARSVIGAWLAGRDRPGQRRRAVAVDGKMLRGARPDGR